jgi:uncharacterized lipoprotein YajG
MQTSKILTILIFILILLSCSRTEPTIKTVCSKQNHNVLVACDNSYCEINPYIFNKTEVGGLARCRWEK